MTALATIRAAREIEAGPHFVRLAGNPMREYYAFIPQTWALGAEPLVLVHGISRNAIEIVFRFAPLAGTFNVPLIAPLFGKDSFGMYQQLVDRRSGVRADEALFDILEDAAKRFGTGADRFSLFGFSGGGQFTHRFAMFHPERVSACIPVSAGWYTLPDPAVRWPIGLDRGPLAVDPNALARVPIHIIVGSRDRGDDESLRHNHELDRLQGAHRLQRARRWFRAMRAFGVHPSSSLTVLPRTRHDFAQADRNGLTELVFALLGHSRLE